MKEKHFVKISYTPRAKMYLKRKFKNLNVVEGSLLQLLEPYKDKFPEGFIIIIKKQKDYNGCCLGKRVIEITSKYIYEYLTNSDQELIGQMLLEAIGHEMGHPKANIGYPFFYLTKIIFQRFFCKEKFRYRLVEVFCDHNSLSFTGFPITIHQRVMEEHIREKRGVETDLHHPTWEDRARYIVKDFDEELIREIASDNGCKNEKEIQKQIKYYKKVLENDGYVTKLAKFKTVYFKIKAFLFILGIIYLVFKNFFDYIFALLKGK